MTRLTVLVALVVLLAGLQNGAFACPSCYGASDSPLAAGMNSAILVMLGIISFVLGMFVTFFMMLRKRARMLANQSADKAIVNDKGVFRWNSF